MLKYHPLMKPRKNKFLPKCVYLWTDGVQEKYRVCLKVEGKTLTLGYRDTLYEACELAITAHEDYYNEKPHWYNDFIEFFSRQREFDF